ncbi:MAG: DUF3943 domain-containing protein [Verrucomicrobiota bacterium]
MNKVKMPSLFHTTLRIVVACTLTTAASAQTNSYADPLRPTNSYWKALQIDPSTYESPYSVALFKPQNGEDGARLWSQTKSVFFYGLGVVGVLAALPESATGWEPESDIFAKWVDNVKSGPVWDRDNWAYNYIGHTYSGGVYYQVARKSGYRQWDSFVYSYLMSTFYWEYGVEAFAEKPSIQDLAITPVLGWVYGEWAYQTEIGIREQDNKVLGSKTLGGISLFFLDPIDTLGRGVNRMAGRHWVKSGYGYFTYTAAPTETTTDHTVYLNMNFPIGGPAGPSGPDSDKATIRFDNRDDPVDTGIVGFAIGSGHTILDEKWEMGDGSYTKFSIGLYFTPRFSTRVAYSLGKVEDTTIGEDIFYENYSLDAQYYFNSKRKLRPYITAGFGEQLWEKERDTKSFQWNAGIGLHWQLHRKWALQADWINYYGHDEETYDQNLNASLVYRFGHGEHADW